MTRDSTRDLPGRERAPARGSSQHEHHRADHTGVGHSELPRDARGDPLIGAIAGYGPPVIFLAGPWLLLGLILAGPFAVLLTLIVAMVLAATVLVAVAAAIYAILTAPYRLMRRARAVRDEDRAPRLVPRVAA